MKQIKNGLLSSLCILFLSVNCKAQTSSDDKSHLDLYEYVKVTKEYDRESNTTYYLTRIQHKDKSGNIFRLRTEFANRPEGETVREFAIRKNSLVAINGSMGMTDLPPNVRQPKGIQVIDGIIMQEFKTKYYTLGIKENNELLAYPPEIKAADIIKDGSTTALTGFIPLIENHESVSEELFKIASHRVKHPRQVIAQYDNLDLLIFSCGGRGFDGDGMTAREMVKILKGLNVKFAFNLDGGGSVSTVIKDQLITKKIDGNGTKERLRPNFLYVMEEN